MTKVLYNELLTYIKNNKTHMKALGERITNT